MPILWAFLGNKKITKNCLITVYQADFMDNYTQKAEDGTGSRRPLLGDAGVPPRLLYTKEKAAWCFTHRAGK